MIEKNEAKVKREPSAKNQYITVLTGKQKKIL